MKSHLAIEVLFINFFYIYDFLVVPRIFFHVTGKNGKILLLKLAKFNTTKNKILILKYILDNNYIYYRRKISPTQKNIMSMKMNLLRILGLRRVKIV